MRKTSQDGGDVTSATSGVENEIKKPKGGLLLEFKSKKIGKRTAPNLSEESDDAVVEPLLQKNTDKTNQSAKYFAKAKADTVKEISKLFNDKKAQSDSTSGFGTTESLFSAKDEATTFKPIASTSAPLHNHMNTNVFHSHDNSKANGTTKSQVLVEIDACKQSGYNPSPLIFTTAKIHTDGKTKHMEPVQMTPAPISSTIEVSVSKGGNIITNEKKISNGTSVMNTVFTQPHVNEKAKENTVHVSSSNLQQNKDLIMTDNNSNPTTSLPVKAISPIQVCTRNEKTEEGSANVSKSNNITSVAQSKVDISNTANFSKSLTSPSKHRMNISSPPETFKSISIDTKNKSDASKDVKGTKKLIDEPRILLSESKLKSTLSENIKPIASVIATKTPSEPNKADELLPKLPQTIQSIKNDAVKSEKNKSSLDQETKVKNTDIISSQPIQYKNIKSPVSKDLAIKPNTITSKPLRQKNTPTESSTFKTPESTSDPSAKTLSSSTKIPTQSKVIDSGVSKEIDKPLKTSAKEIVKPTSKTSLNNTTTPINNKNSASTVKPVQSASPSNVSSGLSDTSNKNINITSPSNLKTINVAIAIGASANIPANSLKTQSQSSKTATATVNTKSTSVTSAKTSTKTSTASIKSPQISTPTSATKQPNITAKTSSVKAPPLAFTKTSQVSTSSPGTAPVAKSAVSKVAQVSTSHTTGHKSISSSVLGSSSTSSESCPKTKAPESNKKIETKPSDHTKDSKASH